MPSLRRRLTVWYIVALGVTVGAFGAALYFDRRRSSTRELDERLELEGQLAGRYFVNAQQFLGRPPRHGQTPSLLNAIGGYLDAVPDYVIVFDPDRVPIFRNAAAKGLGFAALSPLLERVASTTETQLRTGTVQLEGVVPPVRFALVPLVKVWSQPGALIVAAPVGSVPFGPGQLLSAMLVIAPVILLVSIGLGYVLADRTVRPLAGMIDQVEAITDGRSLDRRLAVPQLSDELARLAVTMNRMLARLEESFTSLRRFTADASHELKTPLMVLRAGVERALTHPGTPPEAMGALDEVLEEINRTTELVDNLLTLARADEGRAVLAVQPIDLRELVSEAAETAGILGEEKGLAVRSELPAEPVVAAVDPSRIRQLLLNLVTNAINYTPPEGKVSLGLVDRGATVALIVGDNGVGIPAADLPHIFDRFYRVDSARSRTGASPGAGLGLAITKWIAEAHGGTITVQSRLGRGTVFTVTLPRNETASATPPAATPAAAASGTSAGAA
jgi:signal transduction histidine kinase